MKDKKTINTRKIYVDYFKQEVIRMLAYGRNENEISDAFGIAENKGHQPGFLSLEKNDNKKDKIDYRKKWQR